MNQDQSSRRTVIIILSIAVVVAGGILMALYFVFNSTSGVKIANLDSCSPSINPSIEEAITGTLLHYVEEANSHNGKMTMGDYQALVREGSCSQTDYTTFKRAKMIVDIEQANQSWLVEYDWIRRGQEWLDLGDIAISCLSQDQLIFGDFDCDNLEVFRTGRAYTLVPVFPIEQHLPYQGRYYTITSLVDQDGALQIVIKINMKKPTRENNIRQAEIYQEQALDKIREFGFNPADFNIVTKWLN